MLVNALCLRDRGRRLTADELRPTVPMMGNLRYEESPTGLQPGRGALTCLLMPLDQSVEPQVQLFHARVKSIGPRGIIIVGSEDVWQRKRRTSYRQALWAWPIPPERMTMRVIWPTGSYNQSFELLDAVRKR